MKATIFLDESINIQLNPKGEVSGKNGAGRLLVKNNSEGTTLWAITLSGKHGPDVKDFSNQQIPHIQAGENFEDSYQLDLQGKLILSERLDTHYTGQEGDDMDVSRNTLIKGLTQKVLYEISLENKYSFPIKNVELLKAFNESTEDYDSIPPHPGAVEKVDGNLIWKLDQIEPGQLVAIYIVAEMTPKSSTRVDTGQIDVTCGGSGIFSSLVPAIDSECDNVDLSVNVNETPTPGLWVITTEYTNSSEFTTLLESVKVGTPDNAFLNQDVQKMCDPNPDVPSWKDEAEINSPDYPHIEKVFKYQVDYEVISKIGMNIVKSTDLLDVVEVHVEKQFNPDEVNTYTRTPFNYTVVVKNTGTAQIGKLEFKETLPPYILVRSVKTEPDANTVAVIEGQEGLDAELPENLSQPRTLNVKLKMEKLVPGTTMTLTMDCVAEKPKPNLDYKAPSTINAFAINPTTGFQIASKTGETEPELKVAYKMRSFKFSANYKAISSNEYEITIPIINNGEVPLENIYLSQGISGGKYASHSPLTITAEDKGDLIEFYIKRIPVGETISVIVSLSTEGPIRQTQPSIRIAD